MMNQCSKRPPELSRMKTIMETQDTLFFFEASQCSLQQSMLMRPEFHPVTLLQVGEENMEAFLEQHDRISDCDRTGGDLDKRFTTTRINERILAMSHIDI